MLNFLGCSAQGIAVANGVTTLALLERMQSEDINQMPVVADSGSPGAGRVVGIVTRDSILRVIRTRTEMGARATQ